MYDGEFFSPDPYPVLAAPPCPVKALVDYTQNPDGWDVGILAAVIDPELPVLRFDVVCLTMSL
jgi:hypothetical protein